MDRVRTGMEYRGRMARQKPLFIVQSPPQVFPPAAMSYVTFPKLSVTDSELQQVATTAIQEAAKNYQVSAKQRNSIQPKPTTYNQLNGYEAEFSGIAQGEVVDVKVLLVNNRVKAL